MQISDYFINGDIKGAIAYMRSHAEFSGILPAYTAIFEDEQYLRYDLPEQLDRILRAYQVYYRDVFYCGLPHGEAAEKLFAALREEVMLPDAEEIRLDEALQALFEEKGYHALFGRTQGYCGPYVWKETQPTVYKVELPCSVAEYTVNILKGFIFRSWMDYLTFGRFGTSGWASPDGTINCIAEAYDFESEAFLVSLLKHEAQHTVDMKQYLGITSEELEYRAKLVELHYSHDAGLLQRFLAAADESRTDDGHAMASVWIKHDFIGFTGAETEEIQAKALELLLAHNQEMAEKYAFGKITGGTL